MNLDAKLLTALKAAHAKVAKTLAALSAMDENTDHEAYSLASEAHRAARSRRDDAEAAFLEAHFDARRAAVLASIGASWPPRKTKRGHGQSFTRAR